MNDEKYKASVDRVKFSDNFEQDTINLLIKAAGSAKQKEENRMNPRKIFKVSVIAAVMTAILSVSVFAVYTLLTPGQAARHSGDYALAEAFGSEDALLIGDSVQTGEYKITLGGIVSGKGLTDYCEDVLEGKSYAVVSVEYADGRKIAQAGDTGLAFTPLVSGYKPWQLNAWTLGGGYQSFVYEGVDYYVFECANIEIFADRTVYLAVYEGMAPSSEIFAMDGEGAISFKEGFSGAQALFTLPLDPSKADPDAVRKLLEDNDLIE